MVRLCSPFPDHHASSDHHPSHEFDDLDSYLLDPFPDFDPVKEWLVDPDHPAMAEDEAVAPDPDGADPKMVQSEVKEEPLCSLIDEKMEKVSLAERSGHPNIGRGEQRDGLDTSMEAVGAKENDDGLSVVGVSGDKDGIFLDSSVGGGKVRDGLGRCMEAVKVDGVSDVCSVSDSIKMVQESEESSETETDSSSTSSEEGRDDDSDDNDDRDGGDDDANDGRSKGREMDEMEDVEEGEIRDLDQGEVVVYSDEDDEEVVKGSIKFKHQIEVLPPVPQVDVILEPHHQTLPVGVISSILGTTVIVEASEKHNPLNEGSILWITETRSPLGLVDEIFGPVKSPYYVVRYNSDKEVPVGISVGTAVSFVMEYANHILNEKDLYRKGYDASGENDEEVTDEVEFSDDEKEAEYRRSLRQSKRGANDWNHRSQESAIDRKTNFKGAPSNDKWHRNKEAAIDRRTTNFKGALANDRWHGNEESAIGKKRTNFKGAPIRKFMRPPVPSAPPGMGQPLPSVPDSLQALSMPANFGCGSRPRSVGSGNAFMSTPPMVPGMPQAVQLGSFNDLSQQLLQQQTNAAFALGFLSQQQQQMGTQGGYPMNVSTNPQLGDTTYHHQHQNQVFNGFPNAMACQQQFVPNLGAQTSMQWPGGPLNLSVGPTSLGPVGQSGIGQVPFGGGNAHGQGTSGPCNAPSYGQPSPDIAQGGMWSPMQFNQSIGSTLLGPAGNVHEQGSSGSWNAPSYGQPPPAIFQGEMSPMQFNPSAVPASLGQVGQSSVGQAPVGSSNVNDQGSSGSCNAPNFGQPPSGHVQGGMHPPMQFNSGRLPFRGRQHHRGGGRHSFGRGGRRQIG